MESDIVQQISKQVARSYPQMSGVRPTVRRQTGGQKGDYLLTFRTSASLPGGKTLAIIVRVVADEHGRILKITTSR
jgi:hypothetical protein